jgi:glutaredoxin
MKKSVFYHAGCPVCTSAQTQILEMIDSNKVEVEVVHLGEQKERIADAEAQGVKSVPAIVIDGEVLHINFGASLSDLKG